MYIQINANSTETLTILYLQTSQLTYTCLQWHHFASLRLCCIQWSIKWHRQLDVHILSAHLNHGFFALACVITQLLNVILTPSSSCSPKLPTNFSNSMLCIILATASTLQFSYIKSKRNKRWRNYLENGKCSRPDILRMYFSQLLEPCDQLEGGLFRFVFLCNSWNHAGVSMFAYFTTAVDFTSLTTNCLQFCNIQCTVKQSS